MPKTQIDLYIQRNTKGNLQQTNQQDIMPGKRKRSRPNRRCVDDLEDWTRMTTTAALKASREITVWKCLIHNITPHLQLLK